MCIIGRPQKVIIVPQNKPLIGYRTCEVTDEGTLAPLTKTSFGVTRWEKKIVEASSVPSLYGDTGLWCFNTLPRLLRSDYSDKPVLLKIKIWGTIVQHTLGYRAEFASVQKMMINENCEDLNEDYCFYDQELVKGIKRLRRRLSKNRSSIKEVDRLSRL